MSDPETTRLSQENDYLKRRCAQLQEDVTDLSAQVERLRQQLERASGRSLQNKPPNPLSGGQ